MRMPSAHLAFDGNMPSLRSLAKSIDSSLDLAEAGVLAFVIAAIVAIVIVGLPAYTVWLLFHADRPIAAVIIIVAVVAIAISVMRDLRSRQLGWISALLAAGRTLASAYVGLRVILA